MTVKDLIKALLDLDPLGEVVIDTDDTMEGNYKSINHVTTKLGGMDNTIIVLEHRW